MKVVILAGGLGTRISEYTKTIPKPMIKIKNKPLIHHIMDHYAKYGHKDFYIALGYKGHVIKNYFKKKIFSKWNIHLVETGKKTMTGGRLKKFKKLMNNERFLLTYGDGLSNVNIKKLINFHIENNKIATLTAVKYKNPKGVLLIDSKSKIKTIKEKPTEYINGGFFVLSNKIFKYLNNDRTIFEKDCLPKLTKLNQLLAFKHNGFWGCMDTIREKKELNKIWKSKQKAWKVWF